MKWMPAAQHLPPNRTPVVVETWFGHFLAAYVAPESVTFEDFYRGDLGCYDEEYARDFVHTGWYARCQNGYFPYWPRPVKYCAGRPSGMTTPLCAGLTVPSANRRHWKPC